MSESRRRSIRFRLSLWVALAIFLFAAGTGLYLYASVETTLAHDIQRDLEGTARVLHHKLVEDHDPIDKELLDVGDHLSVRVIGQDHRVVLESPGLAAIAPADRYPAFGTKRVRSDGIPGLDHTLKILTVPFPGGWFQIVRNCDTEEDLLRKFRYSLAFVLAVLPFLGFLTGMWGLGLGLRPIQAMAGHAGSIRPESLGLRLGLEGIPTELEPLALAINATLDRLEGAFTRLSRLNADLAHELRSPLHALRLELEAILHRPELAPDLTDRLGGWMEDIDHLICVIEQMLFLAQAEDPTLVIHKEVIPAGSLLQLTVRPFCTLAEDRGIGFSIEAAEGLLLYGDPTLLRQALHNLIANALRHSPDGGQIKVVAMHEPGGPLLSVEDQGPGFPQDLLPQVGRRFLRVAGDAPTGCTGLGLAIASGIAHLHGGDLVIENLAQGGVRARLTLDGLKSQIP